MQERGNNNLRSMVILGVIGLIIFGVIFLGTSLTEDIGKSDRTITKEKAMEKLEDLYKDLDVQFVEPRKVPVELEVTDLKDALPDIDKYPVSVNANTSLYVEIFSSTEKAGSGKDGWLNEVAEDFNRAGYEINGKPVSVEIRGIASGTGTDYISSGKYIPDAFSPSNELWGYMLEAGGLEIELIDEKLVGNVPGVLFSKEKQDEIVEKYGAINLKNITEAVAEGELAMGYTNPFASSTGLNFLMSTLMTFDEGDPLSDTAIAGFEAFQTNIPFVAFTTLQMRESAKSGVLDGFIMEYQTYTNSAELRADYVFTPFGVRHDSPLYALGDISSEKKELLELFADFCQQSKYQDLGKDYGFNNLDEYKPEVSISEGDVIAAAQRLWKDKKDSGVDISAVFVADISGSMEGDRLNNLKRSLLSGANFIDKDNSVGLVTFSSDVNVNLPIGKFDLNQRSLFAGAVTDMQASGGTAMFDAIVVAANMLMEEKATNPDAKLMLFVLTDGETNRGYSFNDIEDMMEALKIPIYTIGYDADIQVLQNLSNINEAASVNADTEDVIYKLQNLFNAQM